MEKNNYVVGIIGAIIGAFIASVPWVLVYVFGNMMFSYLALIVGLGAYKGYQIFKAKEDKKLPIIITVVSILVVIINTLVIIPLILLAKEGYIADFKNLSLLYGTSQFSAAVGKDLVIAVIFTFLGIAGITKKIKTDLETKESEQA